MQNLQQGPSSNMGPCAWGDLLLHKGLGAAATLAIPAPLGFTVVRNAVVILDNTFKVQGNVSGQADDIICGNSTNLQIIISGHWCVIYTY